MANQPETSSFDAGVYQLEPTDPVQGGVGGVANSPLLNLANRTRWLYNQISSILTSLAAAAGLNSPAFTGTPTAPTPPVGDASTKIATMAAVAAAESGVAVVNVAGSANVVLTQAQYGLGIIWLTGAITANIAVIFPVNGRWTVYNGTSGAFTVTCKTAAGTGIAVSNARARPIYADGTNVLASQTDFPSVALTGNSTATTQGAGDNSTNIATTAWVKLQSYITAAALAAYATQAWVTANFDVAGSASAWGATAQNNAEAYADAKIAALARPIQAYAEQNSGAGGAPVTVSVSFTAPCAGLLIAHGGRTNSIASGSAFNGSVNVNGGVVTGDASTLNLGAFWSGTTGGGAVSASYVTNDNVQFTARVMLIFIPYNN